MNVWTKTFLACAEGWAIVSLSVTSSTEIRSDSPGMRRSLLATRRTFAARSFQPTGVRSSQATYSSFGATSWCRGYSVSHAVA